MTALEAHPPCPTVTVVVPVHDNADSLPELQQRLQRALCDEVVQIVMVDDGSRDASLSVLRGLPVEVVALERSGGQNAAILAGLAHARAPLACVLDADLQDPPEAMPKLLSRLRQADVQVVFSSRQASFRLSSRLFRAVMRTAFPSLPKTPCLCFAIDEAARAALLGNARSSDYLVAVIGALAVATTCVPVTRAALSRKRQGQRGLRRWRYAARMLSSTLSWKFRTVLGHSHAHSAVRSDAVARDAQERSRPLRAR